jgi:hypothetical protein
MRDSQGCLGAEGHSNAQHQGKSNSKESPEGAFFFHRNLHRLLNHNSACEAEKISPQK